MAVVSRLVSPIHNLKRGFHAIHCEVVGKLRGNTGIVHLAAIHGTWNGFNHNEIGKLGCRKFSEHDGLQLVLKIMGHLRKSLVSPFKPTNNWMILR